jgi:hypothetical protein
MIDQTRYKAWRSGPDAELHVIVYEGAELPRGISSLGPWLGSREGEIANLKPHYRAMLRNAEFVVVRRRAVEFSAEVPVDLVALGNENMRGCRAALRMIREVIEMHAPPGSVPSEEHVEPPFTAEAEALVRGVLALAYRSESRTTQKG